MRKLGAEALSLAALAAVSIASSGPGCSTTQPTELVPGVSSQVVVPRDLQAVRVTVVADGRTVFDEGYDVAANGVVQLPSTLGVVSGATASSVVTITVRGYETPCESADDCNQLLDMPVGSGTQGSQILRRSTQTFVNGRTLFVPMPLTYSCWNTNCGDSMGCKGNTCVETAVPDGGLVDFNPSILDGTDVCFSPKQCFGDSPDGGADPYLVTPTLVDAATCTYSYPAPAPLGLNVRVYYQNFDWVAGQPVFQNGAEQEILNEDPVEGFTVLGLATTDAGASDAGTTATLFKLAPGLCKLANAALTPPAAPAPSDAGAPGGYITISDLRVAALCPPKTPLLPICAAERKNTAALPLGPGGVVTTTDGTCNVGVPLAPTQSALYLVMDQSEVMHGAFGPMGSATALSLSLADPVFKRTYAAFTFLPGNPADCTAMSTPFTAPAIDFGLASTVQSQIADKLNGWVAPDTADMLNPLELQAAMRIDAGAYKHVSDFLVGKEPPNIAAAMFFVNRAPEGTVDCTPPLNGQATVKAAMESQILAAYNATPSIQTYFVVLGHDADDGGPTDDALAFYQGLQTDLPQAVQTLDATQTMTSMQAAQTAGANFSKLVTQLGTCLYEYGLPASTDPTKVQVSYTVPLTGQGQTVVPYDVNCSAATQSTVDGWNLDNGRLRMCGNSCTTLRNGVLTASAVALQNHLPDPDVPVTAQVLCSGTALISDGGVTNGDASIMGPPSPDASVSDDGGATLLADGAAAVDAGP